jgi:hypothetical protein
MSGLEGKPFAIPEQLVWQAYTRVKANGGAIGADGVNRKARRWWQELTARQPRLFAHWAWENEFSYGYG